MSRYRPVDPRADFPAVEREILAFWKDRDVFRESMKARRGRPEWVFYDGPPTANNRPHIGHVEARTFKDLYPRFRTMTGHLVTRKAGWDCHGLPVEVEVEKTIGTRSKRDIEEFGVAEFVRLCRESVQRYVEDWKRVSERMGFWIDMDDAYWTMYPEYVESVWWALKTLFDQGLLFEDDKSVAYCPRCGTGLSDHEVALGYATVKDPSVFVKLPVTEAPDGTLEGAGLVVWTTTPWTLLANLAVAVAPEESYAVVETGGERLVVAERLVERVLGDGARPTAVLPGSALVGARYDPPYPNIDGDTHRVVAADFVSMDEGTGLVHIAPGFGPDDLALGRREGWPAYHTLDDAGHFTGKTEVEFVRGLFVKEADPRIIEDLRERGRLLREDMYEHTYPLCWRCSTPLLYMARSSWYVRTTARKDRLLEVNDGVNWYPGHIKHGRYGDWLENNVDWALSRERYWGTPLPLWRCEARHVTPVGSLRELSELSGRDVTSIDPHRPVIDEVTIPCPRCGLEARRVPEVIDAWFDSGAMPFAQWGYHPGLDRGAEEFDRRFPADFIAEGIDQTRGWFYSMMAEGVLLFDRSAYRNVVCHGLVLDAEGRKMSKRLGNVIEPEEAFERFGADAVRWFMVVSGSPWADRRASFEIVGDVVRQFLLTLWNVYAFFVTYANADGVDAATLRVPLGDRPVLDRWILSRLHRTVREVRRGLEDYDATGAGRRIAGLVDDLSNWYVRRARRRFWDPAGTGGRSGDKDAAYATLHKCLTTVSRLLAPFTPFVSEALWRNLADVDGPESVHLADYPDADPAAIDDSLEEAMRAVREIASLGRTARNDARIKVRQPLARAVVHVTLDHDAVAPLLALAAEELNVREVAFAESAEQLAGWRARPNFRALGPRLGARVQEVARALAEDDGVIASRLAGGETVTLTLADGDEVSLGPEDVDLSQRTETGWGVAAEGGVTVALDLDVTPELRREGVARDLVRAVQEARKAAGLDVSDRIELAVDSPGETALALEEHRDWVASEVLATRIEDGPAQGWTDAYRAGPTIGGTNVGLALRRARV